MNSIPILSLLIIVPIAAAAFLYSRSAWSAAAIRNFALGASLLTLLLAGQAALMYGGEPSSSGGYRLTELHDWIGPSPVHIQYYVGVDGISMPLILLTVLITLLSIWASFTAITDRHREYYSLLLLLLGAMLGVFCARDLLLFYVFFEFTLIPLYFLIGIWGGPLRTKAANMFFLYTLAGSMLTFAGVLYLGWRASLLPLGPDRTVEFSFAFDRLYELAAGGHLSFREQWWLFLAFFAGFAIKVPLFPFHTWLPLAHTEAPTAGSVVLAAILLKLGSYGFLRLSLPMLPEAAIALGPSIAVLSIAGIIYGALAAWVQTDVKKLVAYSSVSHLGFCLLGMFSLKMAGLTGSLLYMVNHGLSTGALFLVIGMIYERYHTREMQKIGGLARKMPIMAFFLMVFTMSSIGLPGLNGFVSEFMVLLGTFSSRAGASGPHPGAELLDSPAGPLGIWYAVPAATGILLGAIYMLHMAGAVLFGPLKEGEHGLDASSGLSQDLNGREISILAPLAVACLLLGVYPKSATDVIQPAIRQNVLAHVFNETQREARKIDREHPIVENILAVGEAPSNKRRAATPGSVGFDRQVPR